MQVLHIKLINNQEMFLANVDDYTEDPTDVVQILADSGNSERWITTSTIENSLHERLKGFDMKGKSRLMKIRVMNGEHCLTDVIMLNSRYVAYYHTMEFDPEVEADIQHNLIG